MTKSLPWAQQMLNDDAIILDTETTGVDRNAQVIQLSIIDMRGKTLFDSLLRPTCDIHPTATATHHLTKYHLRNAPLFSDVYEVVKSVLDGRTVVAYNVTFDKRMMCQTAAAFKLDKVWLEQLDWQCAMRAYAEHLGVKNAPKLGGGDHTALGDCLATLDLLRRMAGEQSTKEGADQGRNTLVPVEVSKPVETDGMSAQALLAQLAPPLKLVEWMETVFAAKRAKGETVPAEYVRWIELWQDIRSAEPSIVDGATPATWAQVGDMVTKTNRELAF